MRGQLLRLKIPSKLFGTALVLIFVTYGLWAQQTAVPDERSGTAAVDLTTVKAYSKDLAPGQTDWYTVDIAQSDYLEIEIQLHNVEVRLIQNGLVSLSAQPIEVPKAHGTRTVVVLAPSKGQYKLGISSEAPPFSGKAPSSGRYDIRILALRQATEKDRAHIKAGELTAEGEAGLKDRALASLRQALAELQESVALWRQQKETYGVAEALENLGQTYAALGEHRQAIEYFTDAVRHNDTWNDPRTKAAALVELSDAYRNSAEFSKAIDAGGQALPIWQQLGDGEREATTLIELGVAHGRVGDAQEGIDLLVRALALTRRLGDKREEVSALNHLGSLYGSVGQTEKEIEYLKESLPVIRTMGWERGEAYALNNLGATYLDLDQYGVARDYLVEAQQEMTAVKDRGGQALVATNMADLESRGGDLTHAVEHMMTALGLNREVGDIEAEGQALLVIGDLKAKSGDYQGAVEYLGQAAALRESIHDWNGQAEAVYRIARLELAHGEIDQARQRMEQALEVVERFRLGVVNEDLRSSYFATVQKYYEFAVLVLMQLDKIDPAKGYRALAFEISERARARTLVEGLRSTRIDAPTEADRKLLEEQREVEAEISAKTQAQSRSTGSEINNLLDRYYQLQAKIRESNPRFAEIVNPQPLKLADIQSRILDSDTTLVEYMLGAEHSYAWCVTRDSIVAAELAPRAEIEEAAIDLHDRLSNNKPYEEASNKVAGLILGPIASHLRNKRILIISSGVLQYLPFAALPVASSTQPGRPLIPMLQEHELVSAPSASALATIRQTSKSKMNVRKGAVVLADPVFARNDIRFHQAFRQTGATADPGTGSQGALSRDLRRGLRDTGQSSFARLLFTRAEARAIVESAGSANVKTELDFQASRQTAISPELSDYQVVHFATHGILDNEHPELSGLVLSLFNEKGQPQDGFLRLYEVYALKLPVQLVVLSACDTGLGKDVRGEGIISLTRGFMYAGAKRVVVTTWAVQDQATAELMRLFYRAMFRDHLPATAALRAAQLELAKDKRWRPPYYWAGFIIQGDWL